MIEWTVLEDLRREAEKLAAVTEAFQVAASTQEISTESLNDGLYFLFENLNRHAKRIGAVEESMRRER